MCLLLIRLQTDKIINLRKEELVVYKVVHKSNGKLETYYQHENIELGKEIIAKRIMKPYEYKVSEGGVHCFETLRQARHFLKMNRVGIILECTAKMEDFIGAGIFDFLNCYEKVTCMCGLAFKKLLPVKELTLEDFKQLS